MLMRRATSEKPLGARRAQLEGQVDEEHRREARDARERGAAPHPVAHDPDAHGDRKSTRLNSSHSQISYAVFCLKKKKKNITCNRCLTCETTATHTHITV